MKACAPLGPRRVLNEQRAQTRAADASRRCPKGKSSSTEASLLSNAASVRRRPTHHALLFRVGGAPRARQLSSVLCRPPAISDCNDADCATYGRRSLRTGGANPSTDIYLKAGCSATMTVAGGWGCGREGGSRGGWGAGGSGGQWVGGGRVGASGWGRGPAVSAAADSGDPQRASFQRESIRWQLKRAAAADACKVLKML